MYDDLLRPTEQRSASGADKRPPRGVTPRVIWLEHRAAELARAIHEYVADGRFKPVATWTEELSEILQEIDRVE